MLELVEAADIAPKTANNARIALMGFCRWAVRNGHMAFNPVPEVKPLRVEDVRRRFLSCARSHGYFDACSAAYRPLARTLVGTGARISEAIAFTVDDFDPIAGTLAVNRQLARDTSTGIKTKATKGRKRRTVYIGAQLVAVLQDMLAVRREQGKDDGGWLFVVPPARRGRYATRTEPRPPHRKTVHDWHEQALTDAGLDDLPLHGLRHTAAAAWLSTGRSLELVRAQLGPLLGEGHLRLLRPHGGGLPRAGRRGHRRGDPRRASPRCPSGMRVEDRRASGATADAASPWHGPRPCRPSARIGRRRNIAAASIRADDRVVAGARGQPWPTTETFAPRLVRDRRQHNDKQLHAEATSTTPSDAVPDVGWRFAAADGQGSAAARVGWAAHDDAELLSAIAAAASGTR